MVLGDSFIFSNSFDGYISPTLVERYRAVVERRLSEGSVKEDKEEEEGGDMEEEEEEMMGNSDIVIFTATPPTHLNKPKTKKVAPQYDQSVDFSEPFVSAKKKDVITFFLTDLGRQRTLDEEDLMDIPTQTIGEPTPDVSSTELLDTPDSSNNNDIISFTAGYQQEDNGTPAPDTPALQDANLRKPYVSLNYSDIITFYQSENSLLKAYEEEPPKENGYDEHSEDASGVEDSDIEEDMESEGKPDVHVFYNDRTALPIMTSTPKPSRDAPSNIPLVINKHSMVTFFSSESSFLAAVDANLSALVIEAEHDDDNREDESCGEEEEGEEKAEESDNERDIKVFSNSRSASMDIAPKTAPAGRSDSPVLVVTQEFPDIISFYNPNGDDSRDIQEEEISLPGSSLENKLRLPDLPLLVPSPLGNGDVYPCEEEDLGVVSVEPPQLRTCSLEYAASDMWRSPRTNVLDIEPPSTLVPQNTRERLLSAPDAEEVLEEEPTDEEMPGLEGEEDEEDSVSSRHNSSVVIEDSRSEDGTPVRAIQDIENLPDIEQAINMIDAIKDLEIEDLDVVVPEPVIDDYLDEDFERDITEDIESFLSESERFTPITLNLDTASEDEVHRFFDDVEDPEEFLLQAYPEEDRIPTPLPEPIEETLTETSRDLPDEPKLSPRSGDSESAIIEFITQNINKYMGSSEDCEHDTGLPPLSYASTLMEAAEMEVPWVEMEDASGSRTGRAFPCDISDMIYDADLAIDNIKDIISDARSLNTPVPLFGNGHGELFVLLSTC